MSKIGKLLRGLKWHNFRNLDGVYHKDIADDPNKMDEVNFYLDFIKTRDANKVHKILQRYMVVDLSCPQHRDAKMERIAKELDELDEEPVKEEKPSKPKGKK